MFISFLLPVVVDHKWRIKHVSGIRAGKKTVWIYNEYSVCKGSYEIYTGRWEEYDLRAERTGSHRGSDGGGRKTCSCHDGNI